MPLTNQFKLLNDLKNEPIAEILAGFKKKDSSITTVEELLECLFSALPIKQHASEEFIRDVDNILDILLTAVSENCEFTAKSIITIIFTVEEIKKRTNYFFQWKKEYIERLNGDLIKLINLLSLNNNAEQQPLSRLFSVWIKLIEADYFKDLTNEQRQSLLNNLYFLTDLYSRNHPDQIGIAAIISGWVKLIKEKCLAYLDNVKKKQLFAKLFELTQLISTKPDIDAQAIANIVYAWDHVELEFKLLNVLAQEQREQLMQTLYQQALLLKNKNPTAQNISTFVYSWGNLLRTDCIQCIKPAHQRILLCELLALTKLLVKEEKYVMLNVGKVIRAWGFISREACFNEQLNQQEKEELISSFKNLIPMLFEKYNSRKGEDKTFAAKAFSEIMSSGLPNQIKDQFKQSYSIGINTRDNRGANFQYSESRYRDPSYRSSDYVQHQRDYQK